MPRGARLGLLADRQTLRLPGFPLFQLSLGLFPHCLDDIAAPA